MGHYNKAIELYDQDVSFLTNRAAVFLEMGEYQKCIADCDEAYEKGRGLRADYKLLARALARKGGGHLAGRCTREGRARSCFILSVCWPLLAMQVSFMYAYEFAA